MIEHELRARDIAWLCGLAFLVRCFVALLAAFPAEDAANYLWMAQRFPAGAPREA